ncbi:FAD-binding type PCMH-like superfamily [Arabidopsis thaliana x Arabidopsis arenosa]|uniref:L-gulonolactone oxidase n=1 Tax=Arabidopsis thaliana x Arabidopsis arenosa TaxID=1240361 RepID=A0A8T2AF92_9BRAS|nr:FAD-binding type PCMH-like superfamily [Arabidopsis thaliana x Arabidopsis arenosa]
MAFGYSPSYGSNHAAFWRTLLGLYCLITLVNSAISTPPEDPVKCVSGNTNCTVTTSLGAFPDRSTCRAANVAYPTSEAELVSIVAAATKAGRKMRVTTRYSHSSPTLVCTDGKDGLFISTKFLNHTVRADAKAMTLTVESGMTLRQLIAEAAKVGLALPYAPYWWGVTVGGMMGTGAHGSSLWDKGSAVHDYVTEIRMVSPGLVNDGFAKIRVLSETTTPNEFNAAKVSLGVLGVISQVTFTLQLMFKRSIKYVMRNDLDFNDQVLTFGKKHEFADFVWLPSQGKVVYRMDDRVAVNTSGNGLYDFLPFRSQLSPIVATTRSSEETQETLRDANGKCVAAKAITSTLFATSYGLTNNGIIFTGYPVIGSQNRMMSSGSCLDGLEDKLISTCAWDSRIKGLFIYSTGFSVPLTQVSSFINDIKSLVKIDSKSLCGLELYYGILMRYVTSSPAYLGKETEAIDFDITYYRANDPLTPRLYEDFIEEIEQIALFKYNALPHWGKNRNLAFDGVIKKYKNAPAFLKVKESYDPKGLFSSEWTDQILGIKGNPTIVKDGCALEGLCICSEDAHCAPTKGYLCRPGKVYKEARVCTHVTK